MKLLMKFHQQLIKYFIKHRHYQNNKVIDWNPLFLGNKITNATKHAYLI